MSKILMSLGSVLVVAGLGLAFAAIAWPAQFQLYGLMPDAGILLFVGGLIVAGLAGVIDRIENLNFVVDTPAVADAIPHRVPAANVSANVPVPPVFTPSDTPLPESREEALTAGEAVQTVIEKAAEVEAAAISALATTRASLQAPADAVMALERARSELAGAVSLERPDLKADSAVPEIKGPELSGIVVEETIEETVEETLVIPEEGTLYIIEERIIHGRPSRLLSDGTVEAETDEGWMRFENAEHLEEYLDAMRES